MYYSTNINIYLLGLDILAGEAGILVVVESCPEMLPPPPPPLPAPLLPPPLDIFLFLLLLEGSLRDGRGGRGLVKPGGNGEEDGVSPEEGKW